MKTEDGRFSLEGDAQDRALLAEQLVKWRLRLGLTQKEVSDRWGLSKDSIMRAEKARYIAWPMLYRISARLTEELRKEGRV